MMVLKATLEISCSSTTFIKEVFANLQWIRRYRITKLRCQSDSAALNQRRARVVADRPQAVAAMWRPPTNVGPTRQADAGIKMVAMRSPSSLASLCLSLTFAMPRWN